jgi:DNA-binding PadR family transcriptional regulator
MIIKEVDDRVERLTHAPRTGIWRMEPDGRVEFGRWANDWHSIVDESEAFFLRIIPPGDYRYRGADLGALVTRGRMQTDDFQLSERGRTWIEALRRLWTGVPLPPTGSASPVPAAVAPFKFG